MKKLGKPGQERQSCARAARRATLVKRYTVLPDHDVGDKSVASKPVASAITSTSCNRPSVVTMPSGVTDPIPVVTNSDVSRCIAR